MTSTEGFRGFRRVAVLGLLLLVAAPAGPSAGDDAEESYRGAMLRTYVHGVDDALAREVLGEDGLPLLRRLLAEPGFPRRDNVVAFLGHLDRGESTSAILDFLSDPPAGWERPAEDRALLLAPVALGHVARRGNGGAALDALLLMTDEGSGGGVLARAAAKGADPRSLEADLLEEALRGLAFSGSPDARDRLADVALGRLRLEGDGRDLARAALRSLDLYDEVHRGAPTPTPPASGSTLDDGLGASGTTVDRRTGGEPPQSGADFDTQSRVHDNGITYTNHVDLSNPMTDARLDDVFEQSDLRVGRSDYGSDVGCCVTFSRVGTGQTFGSPGDGLDRIDDSSELNQVFGNNSGRVKVVRSINYCGGPGSNILGCGATPGTSIALVRMGLNDESILWPHEYGHNTGLGHSGSSRHIMYRFLNGGNDGVTQNQCDFYHSPFFLANPILTDTGPCSDNDADEVQDGIDNCPGTSNSGQSNSDSDSLGNACDNCDNDPNPGQLDNDNDGQGDVCDADDDNDGALDGNDCAPFDPSASQIPGRAEAVAWDGEQDLHWTPGAQTDVSNLYRGTIAGGFNEDWSCLADDVAGTSYTDADSPPVGQGFHYLVSGENVCGESDAGESSEGSERPVTPCP